MAAEGHRGPRSLAPADLQHRHPASARARRVTWAHHALLHNDRKGLIQGLTLHRSARHPVLHRAGLRICARSVRLQELDLRRDLLHGDRLHGFHVLVGTIFLLVCLIRAIRGDFTPKQHFGFEAAAWYWHFVDVVWLFLFFCIYVWGGWGAPLAAG